MKLSASLYAADPIHLASQIEAVAPVVASLHVDVMDGLFAPAFGFGVPLVQAIARQHALPIDVHLMVTDPGRWVKVFAQAGVRRIAFHVESTPDPRRIAKEIRSCGALAYAALLPDTPVSAALDLSDAIDGVLLLTAPPGGGSFSPAALARARELTATLPVIVDGAIEPHHFETLRHAPVELVVVGRALFQATDLGAQAVYLQDLLDRSSGDAASRKATEARL